MISDYEQYDGEHQGGNDGGLHFESVSPAPVVDEEGYAGIPGKGTARTEEEKREGDSPPKMDTPKPFLSYRKTEI